MNLPEKIVALHDALDAASVPHAFGGALALAWCTERARGTIDIDVNVFVATSRATDVFVALPPEVSQSAADLSAVERDAQVRLWWDRTPVDLFFNASDFHEKAADRCRVAPLLGRDLPFLACRDIAVFKAFFARTKDWADLEAMRDAGTLDVDAVTGVLARVLGPTDERVERLLRLTVDPPG